MTRDDEELKYEKQLVLNNPSIAHKCLFLSTETSCFGSELVQSVDNAPEKYVHSGGNRIVKCSKDCVFLAGSF